MKNRAGLSSDSIMELLRELVDACTGLLTHGGRALMRLPLPRLMLICIGLAFMLTILPLAFMLFLLFLGVKLVLLLAVLAARKARRRPLPLGHSGSRPGD